MMPKSLLSLAAITLTLSLPESSLAFVPAAPSSSALSWSASAAASSRATPSMLKLHACKKNTPTNYCDKKTNNVVSVSSIASATVAASLILLGTTTCTSAAWAVSGGGLDYANLDITGQDFSGGNYKGKDFTQVIAKGTTFAKSNLQGCRFYKAYLVNANFESTDARGASFEDTSMENANLKNINAAGSYFGQSLLDVATMENGDFSEAQIPVKTLKLVCEREDVKGTNPVTGVDTRESLMCLD